MSYMLVQVLVFSTIVLNSRINLQFVWLDIRISGVVLFSSVDLCKLSNLSIG